MLSRWTGIVALTEVIPTGDCMRHDWIFDVLTDLRFYAQANGLTALARKAEETLQVARAEIAAPILSDQRPDFTPPLSGKAN